MSKPNHREYEPGLEVANMEGWNNKASLPEVAPTGTWDQKTAAMPQVVPVPNWNNNPYSTPQTFAPQTAETYGQFTADGYHNGTYHQTQPPMQPMEEMKSTQKSSPTICGIRKKLFYIILGVGIVVVVAAIAIGVGAGLAFGRSSDSGSSNPKDTPESTKTALIECPGSNNKTYINEENNRIYRIRCGIDYNAADGAEDITSAETDTMAACIDKCASRPACVGAGWGNFYGTNVCFMKSALGNNNRSPKWYFATEENREK